MQWESVSSCQTSKVIWCNVHLKGKWQITEIMARQSMGKETMVSYSEVVRSNAGCGACLTAKREPLVKTVNAIDKDRKVFKKNVL